MQKKVIITASGLLATLLFLKIYIDTLPDYGIKSRWKKLLLHNAVTDDVPKISVQDAQAKKEEALFLDTRSKEEYNVSHIEGARFVGYREFNLATLEGIPKSQPVITYCSIGKRSGEIGRKLIEAGYKNVHNLYGGLFEWINQGHLVVDTANTPTEKVHPFDRTWGKWLEKGDKVY
jgi:rhodanese-related sulfurtransferase